MTMINHNARLGLMVGALAILSGTSAHALIEGSLIDEPCASEEVLGSYVKEVTIKPHTEEE